MEIAYFDLSGGINQASTKTELGLKSKDIIQVSLYEPIL